MGFRVHPDGTIETDSVEQAIELARRYQFAGLTAPVRAPKPPEAPPPSSEQKQPSWPDFVKGLSDSQMKALKALKLHSGMVTIAELMTATGAKSPNAIGGIFVSIAKAAKKMLLPVESVFVREVVGQGGKASIVYRAGSNLAADTSLIGREVRPR